MSRKIWEWIDYEYFDQNWTPNMLLQSLTIGFIGGAALMALMALLAWMMN